MKEEDEVKQKQGRRICYGTVWYGTVRIAATAPPLYRYRSTYRTTCTAQIPTPERQPMRHDPQFYGDYVQETVKPHSSVVAKIQLAPLAPAVDGLQKSARPGDSREWALTKQLSR
jgi:hypothetical protein